MDTSTIRVDNTRPDHAWNRLDSVFISTMMMGGGLVVEGVWVGVVARAYVEAAGACERKRATLQSSRVAWRASVAARGTACQSLIAHQDRLHRPRVLSSKAPRSSHSVERGTHRRHSPSLPQHQYHHSHTPAQRAMSVHFACEARLYGRAFVVSCRQGDVNGRRAQSSISKTSILFMRW